MRITLRRKAGLFIRNRKNQSIDSTTMPEVINMAPLACAGPNGSFKTKVPINAPKGALHSRMAETGPIGRWIAAVRNARYPMIDSRPAPIPVGQMASTEGNNDRSAGRLFFHCVEPERVGNQPRGGFEPRINWDRAGKI